MVNCITCKKNIVNDKASVKFKCPGCGKYEIVRCGTCRKISAKYVCPDCGFVGPN